MVHLQLHADRAKRPLLFCTFLSICSTGFTAHSQTRVISRLLENMHHLPRKWNSSRDGRIIWESGRTNILLYESTLHPLMGKIDVWHLTKLWELTVNPFKCAPFKTLSSHKSSTVLLNVNFNMNINNYLISTHWSWTAARSFPLLPQRRQKKEKSVWTSIAVFPTVGIILRRQNHF